MLGEYVRKAAYFGQDALQGGLVLQHLGDLARAWPDEARFDRHRASMLTSLLKHAVFTVPYYEGCDPDSLLSFPVTQKQTIKAQRDSFLSAAYRAGSALTEISTSGSTGTNVVFLLDREKMARRRAEIIHFNRMAGLEIGMPYAVVHPGTRRIRQKTDRDRRMHNETLVELRSLDRVDLLRAARQIMDSRCRAIIAWPSVLGEIASFALNEGLPVGRRVSIIICMGEALFPQAVSQIAEGFGCPIHNRYSALETGALATGSARDGFLAVNRASYAMEVLKLDTDEPAKEGERGRVVITDLYSRAMPLIRYDIGDLAVVRKSAQPGVAEIESVDGRYVETIYDTQGRRLLPMRLIAFLHTGNTIRKATQFQFAQIGPREYEVQAVSSTPVLDEKVIGEALCEVLGTDAKIVFNYVEAIARLPSGKRPLLVNKYTTGPAPGADGVGAR